MRLVIVKVIDGQPSCNRMSRSSWFPARDHALVPDYGFSPAPAAPGKNGLHDGHATAGAGNPPP
jgi:hypothetical protein